MALAEFASGAQTTVLNTTHTLSTPTSGKTYVLHIDLSGLTAGDVLIIYLRTKVRSTGTMRNFYSYTLSGPQSDPNHASIPVPSFNGCEFQIKQTAGTVRAYDWSVQSLD